MKKLMIALTAVAVGLVANAGSVSWGVTNIQPAPDSTYAEGTTYSVYLWAGFGKDTTDSGVAAAALYTTIMEDLAAADFDGTFSATPYASTTVTYNTDTKKMSLPTAAIPDKDVVSQSGTAFMVIFDADSAADAEHFLVAQKNGSQYVSQTWSTTGGKTFGFSSQETNTNWQSIPEPTSGLLLLLGVAGLALRRRRA